VAVFCALVALTGAGLVLAAPFGTAFTYQGQLRQAGVPVNGVCDFQFSLFDAATGGSQVGVTQAATGVTLVDGRFTVQLDFGGAAFDGNARWLQIATRCPAGSGSFTALDPRQPLSPSPYAMFAQSATSALTAGSATNATNATNATTATSFSGNLAGDVTGTQAATVVSRLQGRNVVNTAPADGAVLRYNNALSQWEPVVPVDVNTIDYVFAYSSSLQAIAAGPGVTNVALENTGPFNGWTVSGDNRTFTAPSAGTYLVQYELNPSSTTPPVQISSQILQNGLGVPGSATAAHVTSAGTPDRVSKSFLLQVAVNDALLLQVSSGDTHTSLVSNGPGAGVSASLTITRIN